MAIHISFPTAEAVGLCRLRPPLYQIIKQSNNQINSILRLRSGLTPKATNRKANLLKVAVTEGKAIVVIQVAVPRDVGTAL
jgi:hypothetical protein